MGELLMVATPLGNLGDLSPRAANALATADFIAAEDTRRLRVLFASGAVGGKMPPVFRCDSRAGLPRLLRELSAGKRVAFATDAGTPGISDPGQQAAARAAELGARITPIPGPCAATAALSASGFSAAEFCFFGFPPHKKGRQRFLQRVAQFPATAVLYESPHRLAKTLQYLADECPHRPAVLARELTKKHEQFQRGSCAELLEQAAPIRGEYTLVLGPLMTDN